MADAPAKLKILVPTSFSRRSELALEFVLRHYLTAGQVTDVYVFHSYDDRTSDFRQLDKINQDLMERMKAAMLTAIDTLHKRGIVASVDTVHRRLSFGKPWSEILKVAGGIGADMIVMGSPSSSQFSKLVERSPCTLVMVKEKDATFVMD